MTNLRVLFQINDQLGGDVTRWDLGENQIQNQEGAEEQMVRNGDAQEKLTQIPSTVKNTCTEEETVPENLWIRIRQQLL